MVFDEMDKVIKDFCPTILDSGERREFSTGAVRDVQEGKGRCDLLPLYQVAYLLPYEFGKRDEVIVMLAELVHMHNVECCYMAIKTFCDEAEWDMPTCVLEVSKHFEEGAKKYGESNWRLGIPTHCYLDSAIRHYLKWQRGDTDERHDRAFVWNVMCLAWTMVYLPEQDDLKEREWY